MSRNPDKYFRKAQITIPETLAKDKGVHAIFGDYAFLLQKARLTGLCSWGMLSERYLPLGFGVAFVQGSPYKKYIDQV